jgi:hypothetical protein
MISYIGLVTEVIYIGRSNISNKEQLGKKRLILKRPTI